MADLKFAVSGFVVEVLEAMAAAAGGADKVGLRISPGFNFYGVGDEDPEGLYNTLIEAISPLGLAYLHLLEMSRVVPPPGIDMGPPPPDFLPPLRRRFKGTMIVAGNFTADDAVSTLASGRADLVAFGRPFIGNPSLAEVFREGRTPMETSPAYYYSPGPEGYTQL